MIEEAKNFKNFVSNLLESLSYGIMIINPEGKVLDLNRNLSFMLNIPTLDVKGSHYRDILNEQIAAVFDELLQDTKSMGFVMDRQINASVVGEIEVKMALATSALRDDEGKLFAITIVCREMTATQELERMRELSKLKAEFIASVSHDLKSPLTSIVGYADLLIDLAKDNKNESQEQFAHTIKDEGMRLAHMIDDILHVAKLESNSLQLKPEQVSIPEMIDEILKIVSGHDKKFKFTTHHDDNFPHLWVDRNQVKRVFFNLVNNAMKYSPQGGEIKIFARCFADTIQVDFTDEGIGMSQEELSRLFEKFFRVKSEATKGIKGTGLGLTIVKKIIEAHGGTVAVKSEPTRGSTFTVILPTRLITQKPEII
ncbi:MAG: PAS domain-containing protein [Candidatus Omnitrophica bacterium]|nr:PAS domain-containing protein [Candidatus Omnitrophota bacterium]